MPPPPFSSPPFSFLLVVCVVSVTVYTTPALHGARRSPPSTVLYTYTRRHDPTLLIRVRAHSFKRGCERLCVHVLFKLYNNRRKQFSTQNAPDTTSEGLKLKIFGGSMPPDPPRGVDCPPLPLSEILDPPLFKQARAQG